MYRKKYLHYNHILIINDIIMNFTKSDITINNFEVLFIAQQIKNIQIKRLLMDNINIDNNCFISEKSDYEYIVSIINKMIHYFSSKKFTDKIFIFATIFLYYSLVLNEQTNDTLNFSDIFYINYKKDAEKIIEIIFEVLEINNHLYNYKSLPYYDEKIVSDIRKTLMGLL